jgi:hypothetical protein
MPLLSCSGVVLSILGFRSYCSVLVFLKDIFTFVFLNRFVIFLNWGLKYAKVVHDLSVLPYLVCLWSFFFCLQI